MLRVKIEYLPREGCEPVLVGVGHIRLTALAMNGNEHGHADYAVAFHTHDGSRVEVEQGRVRDFPRDLGPWDLVLVALQQAVGWRLGGNHVTPAKVRGRPRGPRVPLA